MDVENVIDILNLTKKAVRNTYLSSFLTEEEVERRFYKNILNIGVDDTIDYSCEVARFTEGKIYINNSIYKKSDEYVEEVLTSIGIYSILGNCKEYNVTNSILADYFAKLSLNRLDTSLDEKPSVKINMFNINSIFDKHILLFHELIGEEAMAYLASRIDENHTFYDNLYGLINHMALKGSFDKKTLKKLNKLLKKMYEEQKDVMKKENKYKLKKSVYEDKFIQIINIFKEKYDFEGFCKFMNKLKSSKYNFKNISKQYGLDFSNFNFSSYEAKVMNELIDKLNSFDFNVDSHEDISYLFKDDISLESSLILYNQNKIKNKKNFSINMLIEKLILPAVEKFGLSSREKDVLNHLCDSSDYPEKKKIKKYISD